ncbi:MAG: Diamino hydroxyphospho ribosylaminopyrimidine deaminase [Labilithrix sp.]|nr:Diamino hydroxyphospho ribosylaminopyrimidine deaminase [Labilithrix sp.]
MEEAERARGKTGDNPWVGSVLTVDGVVLTRGHTQGPGEDHAEIGALRDARAQGVDLSRAVLYSTLEPCAFHGRTPACAAVIARSGVPCLVTGIRDPNPRVDGAGVAIVRAAGIEVIEDVCAAEIRRQLGSWVLTYHPHEITRRAQSLRTLGEDALLASLAETYAVDPAALAGLVRAALA